MTVKELISLLLEEEMGKEVLIEVNGDSEHEISSVASIDSIYGGTLRILIQIEVEGVADHV